MKNEKLIEKVDGTILVYDVGKGKRITAGRIVGNTFIKDVVKKLHYYRKSSSYGIQEIVIEHIYDGDVKYVKIIEEDTGKVYVSKVLRWRNKGKLVQEGHGLQRHLTRRLMRRIK